MTQALNTWGVSARDFFATMQRQVVRVITLDGKVYTATLLGVDTYDLVLQQNDGHWVLMPKHAIKLITVAQDKSA